MELFSVFASALLVSMVKCGHDGIHWTYHGGQFSFHIVVFIYFIYKLHVVKNTKSFFFPAEVMGLDA